MSELYLDSNIGGSGVIECHDRSVEWSWSPACARRWQDDEPSTVDRSQNDVILGITTLHNFAAHHSSERFLLIIRFQFWINKPITFVRHFHICSNTWNPLTGLRFPLFRIIHYIGVEKLIFPSSLITFKHKIKWIIMIAFIFSIESIESKNPSTQKGM